MPTPIYPCLWFDGLGKAAAEFYCSVFSNSKIVTDTPMVVIFHLEGRKFMALNGGPMFKINPSISFFVKCKTLEDTNAVWNKMRTGGQALMEMDKYPWSDRYGWLQDKFGVTWQIMIQPDIQESCSITPSFLFTDKYFGRGEEAIQFYTSVFKNSAVEMISYYEDEKNAGKLLYSEFTIANHPFIAMDGPDTHEYIFNEAVSIVVDCENQQEIDYYWEKLTEGGEESQCGWLKDKFGVSWQIVPTILGKLMSDPERSPRVVQAFMQMKKFDIQKLLDA